MRVEDPVEQQVTAFMRPEGGRAAEQEAAQCGSAMLTRRIGLGSRLRSGV